MADWIMSPQARRRLLDTMRPEELEDLAAEIVRDLEAANPTTRGSILPPYMRDAIVETLTHA